MRDIFQGWRDKKNIFIPPIRQKGFTQDVLIRKYIPPINVQTVTTEAMYDEEEPTILLQPFVRTYASVKRIKTGETKNIVDNVFMIGRSLEADYVIKDNPTVSRRHAEIRFKEDGYWLIDLGAAYHTFVSGEQIKKPVRLTDGMRFCLSVDEEFEFTIKTE